MKIKVTPTKLFYVFGSPVTVKKTENVIVSGLECTYAQLCVCDSVKINMVPVGGEITIKPYELANGTYELRAVREDRTQVDIGTITVTDAFATVAEISAPKAINKLAVWADGISAATSKIERSLEKIDKEIHYIGIANVN